MNVLESRIQSPAILPDGTDSDESQDARQAVHCCPNGLSFVNVCPWRWTFTVQHTIYVKCVL